LKSSRFLPLAAVLVFTQACLGTPTPLVPGLEGSVGLPHFGVQTGSQELPVSGPGFVRYRRHGLANFGQPPLVNGLQEVARALHEKMPGARLVLGDLSERYGGKIPRHNSHRNGRDVDLLWFLQTTHGVPIDSTGFVHVGPDGLAVDSQTQRLYRLDVERQWAVVRELLESDQITVQWIFCSRWIEALLIDYARARGESNDLVWRAETVMLQPSDSLPHDDHMHVRIGCTPQTSLTGCDGGGPYWPWQPPQLVLELAEQDLQEIGRQDPLVVQGDDEVLPSG
jgi:penicillin-insensitive murein DD-endopeptidase